MPKTREGRGRVGYVAHLRILLEAWWQHRAVFFISAGVTLLAVGIYLFTFVGDRNTPLDIMRSIKERSVTNEEMGMFWRDTEASWWWYRAPIETQALMIEAFDEVLDLLQHLLVSHGLAAQPCRHLVCGPYLT